MKILVTGGAGYIGSHTIVELIEAGYDVISVDNHVNSSPKSFDGIEKITGVRVKNYKLDLSEIENVRQVFEENPDIQGVIHFAALKAVGESVEDPILYYKNNLISLLNVLECMNNNKVDNFIFSSSATVYGSTDRLPVTEETPLSKAESPYGETKRIGERFTEDFVRSYKKHSLSLRYFNPVGAHESLEIGEEPEGKPNNLFPVLVRFVSGRLKEFYVHGNDYETRDGTGVRDYIHVSDIARAHVDALKLLQNSNDEMLYDVFNLGTGNGFSVMEIIKEFEKVNNVKVNYKLGPRRGGDVAELYADSSKAERILGWKPKYTLQNMVKTSWEWEKKSTGKG